MKFNNLLYFYKLGGIERNIPKIDINMYQLSLSLKTEHKPIICFNDSEKNLINSSINQMIKNKKMEWSFELLEKNYNELFSKTDSCFKNLVIENNDSWEKLEKTTLEINRNLLNYLASQNTFLDHSRHYLSQTFGKTSEEFLNFEKLTNTLFDNHFAYRFLYKMRNYTVHCGFSLCAISIEKDNQSVTYTPKFIIEDLLESKDWGKIVKEDLLKIEKNFSAFNIVKDSFECFKKLQNYIVTILLKANALNQNSILELLKINKENLNKYCFLIDNGEEVKISEIPTHYF